MPKSSTSQWEFGDELFSAAEMRRVFSVTELTTDVRRLLEKQIGTIWVTGEITNFRAQSSGHVYFTLKDANAQLSCIVFRTDPIAHREFLEDGRKVVLKGEMTVYEARGQYQLHVLDVELHGVGALQIAFEKLKQKLDGEGLFAPERKRPLPHYPARIGLVTSPTGAAIRDVLHVIERRNSSLEIILAPCAVQGQGAGGEIASAIRLLNDWSNKSAVKLDLILITRGGGSLEDLWAFNEEVVARAIFNSALPVVSAVGHEIDFTISDFVADLRAATPSAAAELLTEGVFAGCRWMMQVPVVLRDRLRQRIAGERRYYQQLGERLQAFHPRRQLNERAQRIDDLQLGLTRCVRQALKDFRQRQRSASSQLTRVRLAQLLFQRRQSLRQHQQRLRDLLAHQLRNVRHRFSAVQAGLRLLGPQQVLARGYSITVDEKTGKILRDAAKTKDGQILKTTLSEGEVRSRVAKE
ncbi:MAG: exodeoxyribonuclease VII large subunit [Limisphaerales bacterium]